MDLFEFQCLALGLAVEDSARWGLPFIPVYGRYFLREGKWCSGQKFRVLMGIISKHNSYLSHRYSLFIANLGM